MIKITKDHLIGAMSPDNPPAAFCKSGDTVLFETLDCSGGAVSPDGKRDRTPGRYLANPATGPLFVDGAEPGDLLKVEILSISHAPFGFMGTGRKEHYYGGIDLEYPIRIFDLTEEKVTIAGRSFPLSPMIGVIGTAPAEGSIGTMTPSFHGGNMDCTRIREGAVLYLPVRVKGALLAMGDLHAAMGDGEVFDYGLETAGEVTVRVGTVKGKTLRMPAVTESGMLWVIASATTLDECSALATEQLYDILIAAGMQPEDAACLMSLKCDLAVCQIVDPNMTVRAGLPVSLIETKKEEKTGNNP